MSARPPATSWPRPSLSLSALCSPLASKSRCGRIKFVAHVYRTRILRIRGLCREVDARSLCARHVFESTGQQGEPSAQGCPQKVTRHICDLREACDTTHSLDPTLNALGLRSFNEPHATSPGPATARASNGVDLPRTLQVDFLASCVVHKQYTTAVSTVTTLSVQTCADMYQTCVVHLGGQYTTILDHVARWQDATMSQCVSIWS